MSPFVAVVVALWLVGLSVEAWCVRRRMPRYARYGITLYAGAVGQDGVSERFAKISRELVAGVRQPKLMFFELDDTSLAFVVRPFVPFFLRGAVTLDAPRDIIQVWGYLPYSWFFPLLLFVEQPWLAGGYLVVQLAAIAWFNRRLDVLSYGYLDKA